MTVVPAADNNMHAQPINQYTCTPNRAKIKQNSDQHCNLKLLHLEHWQVAIANQGISLSVLHHAPSATVKIRNNN